jgi:hypothetical protein
MAGSFISCNPKKYDDFQHVNSTTPMTYSSRTVVGTVKQFVLKSVWQWFHYSLFSRPERNYLLVHTLSINWTNILDFIHHLYLLKIMVQSLNLFVLRWGGETGTLLCSITMSPPHLKMETESVSETFSLLIPPNDGQCQKHWSVYHHQNALIKRF